MKKSVILSIALFVSGIFGAKATILFPHFVDIAPNYDEGNCPELMEAGVDCAIYYSTKPGFMTSTFTEVESFFKDTLPSDVLRTEQKVGDFLLVTYSSENKNEVTTYHTAIYVLQQPDNKFKAVYCEYEVDNE